MEGEKRRRPSEPRSSSPTPAQRSTTTPNPSSADSLSSSDPKPTSSASPDVCKFFIKGTCNRGANCAFLHPTDLAVSTSKPPKATEHRVSKSRHASSSIERGVVLSVGPNSGFIRHTLSGSKVYFANRSLDWSTKELKEGDDVEFDMSPSTYKGSPGAAEFVASSVKFVGARKASEASTSTYNRPGGSTAKPYALGKQASESWTVAGPGQGDVIGAHSAGGSVSQPTLLHGFSASTTNLYANTPSTSSPKPLAPAWLEKRKAASLAASSSSTQQQQQGQGSPSSSQSANTAAGTSASNSASSWSLSSSAASSTTSSPHVIHHQMHSPILGPASGPVVGLGNSLPLHDFSTPPTTLRHLSSSSLGLVLNAGTVTSPTLLSKQTHTGPAASPLAGAASTTSTPLATSSASQAGTPLPASIISSSASSSASSGAAAAAPSPHGSSFFLTSRSPSSSLLSSASSDPTWIPHPTNILVTNDPNAPPTATASPAHSARSSGSSSLSATVPAADALDWIGATATTSSQSLKSTSKSSIATHSTNTSGGSHLSSLSSSSRPSLGSIGSTGSFYSQSSTSSHSYNSHGESGSHHSSGYATGSSSSTTSSAASSSGGGGGSTTGGAFHGNTPAPRIRKRMNTSTALRDSVGQQGGAGSQVDIMLLGGSLTSLPISKGKRFPDKNAKLRWTQTFSGPGCDPTKILLQREELQELLQEPVLEFAVIAELMKIFAHPEFRESGRTDRLLEVVADSPLLRNPKNVRTYVIKLSNVSPPATITHQENLANLINVLADILQRHPRYLEHLALDVLGISKDKIAAAYPRELSEASQELVRSGKALLGISQTSHTAFPLAINNNPKFASSSSSSGYGSTSSPADSDLEFHESLPQISDGEEESSDEEDQDNSMLIEQQQQQQQRTQKQRRSGSAGSSSAEQQHQLLATVDDFRDLPLFPTIGEILADPEALSKRLSKNIVKGKYDSLLHYLDTHFRLLREDAITSIRDAIKSYRNAKRLDTGSDDLSPPMTPSPAAPGGASSNNKTSPSDFSIYHGVRLTGICPSLTGILYRVCFQVGNPSQLTSTPVAASSSLAAAAKKRTADSQAPRVDWARSKKLLYGSLICLSSDNFDTLLWATVANRDTNLLSTSQEIDLRFPKGHQVLDPNQSYKMVESNSTYFEAYRHVLKALKKTNVHSFPFLDYLVHCKPDVGPPSYLINGGSPIYDMRNVFDTTYSTETESVQAEASAYAASGHFNILAEQWDMDRIPTTMDASQLTALQQALTKEIAIIQGPPGTGKTFVGLKLMRALLDNRASRGTTGAGPILIVCYTNHALDQFLEGILQFEPSVVRIGSRSKSELLRDRNLKSLVYEANTGTAENIRARKQLMGPIKELQEAIEMRFSDLSKTFLSSQDLGRIMEVSEEQIASLFGSQLGLEGEPSAVENWLGMSPLELLRSQRSATSQSSAATPIIFQRASPQFENDFPTLQRSSSSSGTSSSSPASPAPNHQRSGSSPSSSPSYSPHSISNSTVDWDNDLEESEDDFLEQAEEIDRMSGEVAPFLKMTRLKLESIIGTPSDFHLSPNTINEEQETDDEMLQAENVWKLSKVNRHRLYIHWLKQYRAKVVIPELAEMCDRYENMCHQKRVLDQDSQVQVLMSSAVVGLTTTGVAKFQNLIRRVGPPIVVVEEAAEVLEAHIVTALTVSTKHIILIGDHEQLRPSTAVHRLAVKYKLDVSMFERLISNGLPVRTLSRQRRMRPQISELVGPIYPNLTNHPRVESYPSVLGLSHNVHFLDHQFPENGDAESSGLSKTNPFEAAFIARLSAHLMLQGYNDKQVTILTAYSGQVKLIRQELRQLNLGNIYVTSVDNYQGQECDIICLSLVRNNAKGVIGFLNTSNRICVALSRAKIGMFILGNAAMLSSRNELWSKVLSILRANNAVGPALALQCQTHAHKVTHVTCATDFRHAEDGGCDLKCTAQLACGHPCQRLCHPFPHSQVLCQHPCERTHPECGHRCTRRCFQDCGPCEIPVLRLLPCGHECQVACADEEPVCPKRVAHTLACGHVGQVLCRELNPSAAHKMAVTNFPCSVCDASHPSSTKPDSTSSS